jgi:glucan phosphoethanolaminetransferase (alkaline phosphatase superfamily)
MNRLLASLRQHTPTLFLLSLWLLPIIAPCIGIGGDGSSLIKRIGLLAISISLSFWILLLPLRWKRILLLITIPFSASAILDMAATIFLGGPLSSASWEAFFSTNSQEVREFYTSFWPVLMLAIAAMLLQLWIAFNIRSCVPFSRPIRNSLIGLLLMPVLVMIGWDFIYAWRTNAPAQIPTCIWDLQMARIERVHPWGVPIRINRAWHGHLVAQQTYQRLQNQNSGAVRTHPSPAEGLAFVLVIGESSRASSWELFGGTQGSTPRLMRRQDIAIAPYAYAPANMTGRSLPMLLGTSTPQEPERAYRELPWISAFQELGFETWWISNQPIGDPSDGVLAAWASRCNHLVRGSMDFDRPGTSDIDLLPALERSLRSPSRNILVIFHSMGSHWRYPLRYPSDQAPFQPCLPAGVGAEAFSPGHEPQLRNAYLNTIVATDKLLDSTIALLQKDRRSTVLAYASDHGENLADDERHLFLHATANPSLQEIHVPLLFWANQRARTDFANRGIKFALPIEPISTRDIFPSLFHLAGITVPGIDSSRSLFAKSRHGAAVQIYGPQGNVLELFQIH